MSDDDEEKNPEFLYLDIEGTKELFQKADGVSLDIILSFAAVTEDDVKARTDVHGDNINIILLNASGPMLLQTAVTQEVKEGNRLPLLAQLADNITDIELNTEEQCSLARGKLLIAKKIVGHGEKRKTTQMKFGSIIESIVGQSTASYGGMDEFEIEKDIATNITGISERVELDTSSDMFLSTYSSPNWEIAVHHLARFPMVSAIPRRGKSGAVQSPYLDLAVTIPMISDTVRQGECTGHPDMWNKLAALLIQCGTVLDFKATEFSKEECIPFANVVVTFGRTTHKKFIRKSHTSLWNALNKWDKNKDYDARNKKASALDIMKERIVSVENIPYSGLYALIDEMQIWQIKAK